MVGGGELEVGSHRVGREMEKVKVCEQRRRKAKIEAELERIEEKMEGYKSRMRELTVSPVKQRR